jgi:hypothetical protein
MYGLVRLARSGVGVATSGVRWLMPLLVPFVVSAMLSVAEDRLVEHSMRVDAIPRRPADTDAIANADGALLPDPVRSPCAYYVALNGTMPVMYGCFAPEAATGPVIHE